jgi:hypothetical protein
LAGAFTPSIPFQPQQHQHQQQQQQQQPPWPFTTANSNAQVPTILPIGNIPLQNTPAVRPVALAPIPAQFALSENTLQQSAVRQGKSNSLNKPDLLLSASSSSTKDVIDCGSGNDIGFCAISEKYPR